MTTDVRLAFEQAATFFLTVVQSVGAEQWDRPGLGQWSVRDLVGHTSRALLTVEAYIGRPVEAAELEGPADYFVRALASIGDPEQVAQRGREAGAALGPDPLGTVRETADRVLALLVQSEDAQLVGTPVGGMRLRDYLPTRTFELVVHSLDLAAATGAQLRPPTEAARSCLRLAADLTLRSGREVDALLALTGRQPLPPGFSVV